MCVGVMCGWVGVVSVLQAEAACNTDTTPTQPHRNSNTHRTKNNTTNVVTQQNSRKLLMMDILMSKTCWAHKKWNKIASDMKLVFYSSTIMHHVLITQYTSLLPKYIKRNTWRCCPNALAYVNAGCLEVKYKINFDKAKPKPHSALTYLKATSFNISLFDRSNTTSCGCVMMYGPRGTFSGSSTSTPYWYVRSSTTR